MSDTKKPVTKISLFPVNAAIWRNQNQRGEAFYIVTFERSYRDEAGDWKSSTSFNSSDLLLLAKLADLAHSEIYELRANDKQAQQEDQAA